MNQPHNPNQHAFNPDTMVQYRVRLLDRAAHAVHQIAASAPEPIIVREMPAQNNEPAHAYFQPKLEQEAREQLAAFYESTANGQPVVQAQGVEVNLQDLFKQSNPAVEPKTNQGDYDLVA